MYKYILLIGLVEVFLIKFALYLTSSNSDVVFGIGLLIFSILIYIDCYLLDYVYKHIK